MLLRKDYTISLWWFFKELIDWYGKNFRTKCDSRNWCKLNSVWIICCLEIQIENGLIAAIYLWRKTENEIEERIWKDFRLHLYCIMSISGFPSFSVILYSKSKKERKTNKSRNQSAYTIILNCHAIISTWRQICCTNKNILITVSLQS
jgi:hypothetical protein